MFFKSCIGFVLSNCLNAKKKNSFQKRNAQYNSIALSVHKQTSVFNTPYTLQSRVNSPYGLHFIGFYKKLYSTDSITVSYTGSCIYFALNRKIHSKNADNTMYLEDESLQQ